MSQVLDVIGTTELAALADVSTLTLANYVKRGAIPKPAKVAGRLMWPRAAVPELLALIKAAYYRKGWGVGNGDISA